MRASVTGVWHAEWAWLGADVGVRADVLIEVEDGRFTRVEPGVALSTGADAATGSGTTVRARAPGARATGAGAAGVVRLAGLTVPGLADVHS
ncbi:MAG TPA: hypothetical protein VGO78_29235, partial [Acidimicrobiales bacterium]|nr:hypothetical protein [Acidimicrobiales bacterium]